MDETASTDYIWPVRDFEDLTPAQRECARDIIDAFHDAMKFTGQNVPIQGPISTSRDFDFNHQEKKNYWHRVFDDWDTLTTIPKLDHSTSVPLSAALRQSVGVFCQDLPPSTCAKRQDKNRAKPFKVRAERRKGATAYIQAQYQEDSKNQLDLLYCDETGKGADPRHITFGVLRPVTSTEPRYHEYCVACKALAVVKHDFALAESACRYNVNYLIYLMRCRLMRVLSDTVPSQLIKQRLPNPTASELDMFCRPDFIGPRLMRRPSTGDRALLLQFLRCWQITKYALYMVETDDLDGDFWNF